MFNVEFMDLDDEKVKSSFWKELKVNYDRIEEEKANRADALTELLGKIKIEHLKEICILLNVKIEGATEQKEIINTIIENEESVVLLYLQQLVGKRKVYIDEYYSYRYYNEVDNYLDSITLIKLLHMYITKHVYLIELTAFIEWKKRGTGVEFYINGDSNRNIEEDMLKEDEQEEFCEYLKKNAKNKNDYKIAMYCESSCKAHIFVLYKKRNDVPLVDFDESKRVKNIESIVFMINMEDRILHIKSCIKQEVENIKSYVENKYGYNLEPSKNEIKEDYDISKFKLAFETMEIFNQDELNDFSINKIAFSRSLLSNSPEIVIGEGKRNIWSSVINANTIGVINIDSLYTIKSINISFRNIKKVIKVLKMEDGSVVFKLDDRGLDEQCVKAINDRFKKIFDIPLNTKLRNKLDEGSADEIDIVLRTDVESKIDARMTSVLNELVNDKIIKRNPFNKLKCENDICEWEKDYEVGEIPNECPFCGCESILQEVDNRLEVDKKKIGKYVLQTLKKAYGLSEDAFIPSKDKRIGKNLMMYRFIYNKNEYRVLIIDKLLTKSKLIKLEKQLVPTLIVYYGIDKNQATLMTPETIQFIQFGMLYNNRNKEDLQKGILDRAIKELQDNMMYHIISAAREANLSIRNILSIKTVDEEIYKSDDFEDDVYAILKHIIYSGAKWGASERGKPLPEGVKAFDYKQGKAQNEMKRAFIFDCKWNYDGKGYDLGKDEKRKAIEYINSTNASSQIDLYCSSNELSAHILISNKFRENQLKELNEHINKHITEGYSTIGVFIDIKGLIEFYDWYRKNYNKIQKYRDKFYQYLYNIFTTNNEIIVKKHWDELIQSMEECFKYIHEIDTDSILKDLIK